MPTHASAEIAVTGKRPDFLERVTAALRLLREKAPADYRLVEQHIGRIKEVEEWHLSGMAPFPEPPTFSLAITTARISLTWCAGAIVHDACHSKQWREYRQTHNTSFVPDSAWTGQEAELRCIAYQIEVLERIGAPPGEIEALRRQDGLHGARANRMRDLYGGRK